MQWHRMWRHQVELAKCDRIHLQPTRGCLDEALHQHRRFRSSGTAINAHRGIRCCSARHGHVNLIQMIRTGQNAPGIAAGHHCAKRHPMSQRSLHPRVQTAHNAVRPQSEHTLAVQPTTLRAGEQIFRPRSSPAHRSLKMSRGPGDEDIFWIN